MFDFWLGDINIAPVLLVFTGFVVLPVQLLLCFRGRSRICKLLPVILLTGMITAAILAAFLSTGWAVLGCIVAAVYLMIMLLVCGIAWGIWALVRWKRQKSLGGNDG